VISFIAQVSPSNATGTVVFFDNGGLIGTATMNQPIVGGAELNGALLTGTHSITATYNGNNNYSGSTSSPLVLTGTSTTVKSSLNPSTVGQSVTFTATVSPSSATGTVTFNANGLPILCSGGSSVTNGQTNCSANLVAGTFSITAVYNSNNNNYSGSSAALTQTVSTH
jgi:Bacterial Ig-like domain (group 3)